MKSANINYMPGVDHLRGVASLIIVFYHGFQLNKITAFPGGNYPKNWAIAPAANPFYGILMEGHSSVALFMVLSGFIFTMGSLTKEIAYRQFIVNRLWRIFPLFVFITVCGMSIHPESYNFIGLLEVLLFQANQPGAMAGGTYLSTAWSVAVEFQFYFAFPFLLRFTQRYGARYLFAILSLFIAIRYLAFLQTGRTQALAYQTIIGRMDQFVLGMLCAILYSKYEAMVDRLRYALPLGIALVVWWMYFFNHHGGYLGKGWERMFWPTADGIAWSVFLMTFVPMGQRLPGLFAKALGFVGEMSFSIYLIHFVVISAIIKAGWTIPFSPVPTTNAFLNTLVLYLPVTLAFSAMTYFVVEKPFLSMRRSYQQASKAEAAKRAAAAPAG